MVHGFADADHDFAEDFYQQPTSEIFAYYAANEESAIKFGDLTLTSAMLTAADRALLAADTPARKIAITLGQPGRPPTHTTGRLSTVLSYFDDEHRLLVVATDPAKPAAANLALATGSAGPAAGICGSSSPTGTPLRCCGVPHSSIARSGSGPATEPL